jgi:tetratricopeptide (TPR) repeat protein
MIRRTILTLLSALLILPAAFATDPWHLPGWRARAVVEIVRPTTEAGVDVAGVRILCQGKARADGGDYRVLDAAGKLVPFQLVFHDAERYSLLSFRAADPRQRFFVYFDNPKAERAPEQVILGPAPGAGPPKGAWVPKYGFVYQTLQRPEGDNPRTIAEMAKLIEGSKVRYGARYQRQVADGYNPFGPSDYYISIYRGWINIPKAGKYQFCTISNEASFSFLDGKELIHWPGRHTVDRGARGEVHVQVELTAGLHHLEYYHEEVTLEQMAYLGWRPSGDAGPFSPIPESIYTAPHVAEVTRYEDPDKALAVFEPVISDSVWPAERSEGQWTRCRFQAAKNVALPSGTTFQWDFGDGQTAMGAEVEHVYLTLGRRTVTLTAQIAGARSTTSWPLLIFEIEHITDQFKEGRPKDYAKAVRAYDRAKLDADSLQELAYLFDESEDLAEAVAVGKVFLQRFAAARPAQAARVRRLMADCAVRLGQGSLDEAIANYQASLTAETPPAEKLDVLGRLIRLVGIERNMPDRAGPLIAQVEETVKKAPRLDDDARAAYRRAVIAAGDVLLWQGKSEGARQLYAKAERLSQNPIPSQVRAARIGAYPNALREYLSGGNYGAALNLVDRWDETFPTEKLKGHTFFWRGKILSLRGQPTDAARYLEIALRLTVGADFEAEERWLLAQTLEQLGRKAEARKELEKLIATGLDDTFTKQAKQKLGR